MSDRIGTTLDRPSDRAVSTRERNEARAQRLRAPQHEAVRLLRAAESDAEWARDQLGILSAKLLIGEATEEQVAEVEADLDRAERSMRRWKAAAGQLDEARGVVRDSNGHVL